MGGKRWAMSGATCIALAAITAMWPLLGAVAPQAGPGPAGSAWAQGHEETDGGHDSGSKGKGGKGGSSGHEDESHDDGGHDDDGHDGGKGGKGGGHSDEESPGGDDSGGQSGRGGSDGQGGGGQDRGKGEAGKGAQGSGQSGGKPTWAQEGIPEVELGRLNVARSPAHVLNRAYDEALSGFSPQTAKFYDQSLDQMVEDLSLNWDSITIIDSPLQNLALLRDALDGSSVLTTVGVGTPNDALAAVFLGVASDKSIPITTETARAVSTILGQPLSESQAAALAADAERIRVAVLAGHG